MVTTCMGTMIGSLAPPLTAEQNSEWGGDLKKLQDAWVVPLLRPKLGISYCKIRPYNIELNAWYHILDAFHISHLYHITK